MTTKTVYVANDGKEFNDKKDCVNYEQSKALPKEIITAIKTLSTFCENSKCSACPLCIDYGCSLETYPDEWKVGDN